MIEEVVSSILDAEDVAQKKIDAARAEANAIVNRAELAADEYKKQMSAQTKQAFADGIKNTEGAAAAEADRVLKQLNAQADREIAAYEKNIDKAVKIILEQLK